MTHSDVTSADIEHIKDALRELKVGQDRNDDALQSFKSEQEFIGRRLTQHMEAEEEGVKLINTELRALNASLTSVIEAMPQTDGRPDFFGHRVDHVDMRTRKGDETTVRKHLLLKWLDYAVIIGAIMVAANAETILKMVLK